MTFTFTNEMGSFNLFGSGTNGFLVCSVSGLEPVELSRSVKSYIGEDGCFEDSSQYMQRIITLSCDLRLDGNSRNEIRNAMRVLSKKCTLLIETVDSKRKITVNSATFTMGQKYNNYQTFVIQLVCDYPHFSDKDESNCVLFKKDKLLSSKSVLPQVFSRRISSGFVYNYGDLKIYPVITITKDDDLIRNNQITLENVTTKNSLVINKQLRKNETITVDIKKRTITSNIDGNILGTLDLYCSLSDFWCDCGENLINVLLDGEQSGIKIQISHYNEYLEAI